MQNLNNIQHLNRKKRQQESLLQDKIYIHSKKPTCLQRIADMGFHSSQLKTLLDKIIDIAISNGVNPWLAVNKFIEDIETQYARIYRVNPATCRTRHRWTITTRIN